MEIGAIILTVIVVFLLIGIILFIVSSATKSRDQYHEMEKRLEMIINHIPKDGSFDQLSKRLVEIDDSSRKSFERLSENLGKLSEATGQMLDVGKTISGLEDLLKPPKLRGGMGETLLEELLTQILPENNFAFQYPFSSGNKVDAIIHLSGNMVPVDAKFPLEAFRRMIDEDDEAQRIKERKQFIRDVKKHIDDISNKYILPDEGTFDFALMYIPAENIYYETMIKDENSESLYPYAYDKKVIPVSPNSFYAYLQVIVRGLRGLQIEKNAQEIMDHLSRLMNDHKKFREEFTTLGSHLKNARNKYDEATRSLGRFEDKLISTSGRGDLPELHEGN